jgi:hypothetical protein
VITTSPVPDFITVTDLKAHLKKSGTDDDAKLAGFTSAACAAIVERIGQVSPVDAVDEVEHRHCRWRRVIVLEDRPVVSVTTVQVAGGDVIPPADPDNRIDGWVLDGGAGVLRHTSVWPRGTIRITYTAGRDPLPGNIRLAALELAAHLWKQSQLNTGSTTRPPAFGDDQVIMPGLAYALPIRVRELLGLGKLPTTDVLVY